MDNYKNKSTVFGLLLMALGVGKSIFPETMTFVTGAPDILFLTGMGVIFGRDAMRKLMP